MPPLSENPQLLIEYHVGTVRRYPVPVNIRTSLWSKRTARKKPGIASKMTTSFHFAGGVRLETDNIDDGIFYFHTH